MVQISQKNYKIEVVMEGHSKVYSLILFWLFANISPCTQTYLLQIAHFG